MLYLTSAGSLVVTDAVGPDNLALLTASMPACISAFSFVEISGRDNALLMRSATLVPRKAGLPLSMSNSLIASRRLALVALVASSYSFSDSNSSSVIGLAKASSVLLIRVSARSARAFSACTGALSASFCFLCSGVSLTGAPRGLAGGLAKCFLAFCKISSALALFSACSSGVRANALSSFSSSSYAAVGSLPSLTASKILITSTFG